VYGVSVIIGPLIGGLITEYTSWRYSLLIIVVVIKSININLYCL
jgi:MFS family permease